MSKKSKKNSKVNLDQVDMNYAPLGWVVLSGPLFIVLFLVITGGEMPWLESTAADEAEIHAAKYNEMGSMFLEQKQYNKAYQAYLQANQIKPDYINALVNISKIHYLRKEFDQAIVWIEKAIDLDPPQIGLLCNNAGLLYAQNQNYEKALEFFERAADSKMMDADVYRNLGKIYSYLGQPEKAVLAYSKTIELHTSLSTIYDKMLIHGMAEIYQHEDDEEKYNMMKKHYDERKYADFLDEWYDVKSIEELVTDKQKMALDYRSLSAELSKIGNTEEANEALKQYEALVMNKN